LQKGIGYVIVLVIIYAKAVSFEFAVAKTIGCLIVNSRNYGFPSNSAVLTNKSTG